ncbi:MAG: HD domain-containing protein [Sphaerochaeta sp.]|nr:HD domain-containing protein [Sphaerochaeta sp.]
MAKNLRFAAMAHLIVTSKEYEILRHLNHHDSSIADHSVAVAYYSYKVAMVLRFRKRLPELIQGALLHDFFWYDWRSERPRSGGLHGFDHPYEAFENAVQVYGALTSVESNIILRHMWPLTLIPPRYPESLIVSLVDKVVSLGESWNTIRAGKGLGVLK